MSLLTNKFISKKTYSLIVIPACFWQESNIYKDMDARQKPSGMTTNCFTYELLSNYVMNYIVGKFITQYIQ